MTVTTIGRTTVHAFGVCPVKDCKRRVRITLADMPIKRNDRWRQEYTETSVPAAAPFGSIVVPQYATAAKVRLHAYPGSAWGDTVTFDERGSAANYYKARAAAMRAAGLVCDAHDRYLGLVVVRGVHNASKACNGHCMSATGPDCECSCAGENHGAAYQL